ncbi:protein tweety homolog 2-like [Maylandia zebra]|uniref:Protein tweety homolog n=3 Tax=Haplochromini TaxID=319058 RepID=A0A3Q2UXR4_HAPBU|nr:protein tweety homolog 2-like isoform X1 [Maylandia zebra]XP_004559533.1 protein tweety homolog 2-like isoform X1 [Maylandia zebra]XP_005940389.1 protein tweety homolog 2-like [Haplochromis burtoni]XP_005940390.1 protein tweety homolog 2-like [Haplochromis burtoni]XP_012776875.1 protein tweety homolog 2-like isoform X1 [Maylandia zebra]XP_026020584.1 protein tweety homolog 2-like isoform X1 [Astatotilapia calliptera]XP_026020585.1 protein tweety homolog 2-like isoform X1 [Astatotilapia cal
MATARTDYVAPWWTYWLHNFPHFNFFFQTVDSTFKPEEASYQQSLIILACVGAVGLGVSLLVLAVYVVCLCCCRRDIDEDTKRPDTCCVTWVAVITGLIICSAVGVGFYGNSETNDGVYQMNYSLYNANRTLGNINNLVAGSLGNVETALKQHLERLDEIFSTRPDYLQALRFMQLMVNNVIRELTVLPDINKTNFDLAAIADQTAFIEYYRWLIYLLLLILDLVICLAMCLGMAKHSQYLLIMIIGFVILSLILSWASLGVDTATAVGISDFCVSPDKFIVNHTKDFLSADVAHYYLFCSPNLPNPFQQSLTTCQRSLTTMQIQIQGLLQFSVRVFPTAERDLLGIQRLLNSTEFSLHKLTALLDCRGLHKDYLDTLMGVCYDGVEGLLYLSLFSLLAACALSAMLCVIFRVWTLMGSREKEYDDIDEEDPFNPQARRISYNPRRSNTHSFCSYTTSLGSQASLHPPPQSTSSVVSPPEYMNQSMLFGGTPRYENVPLIGRGSPPPSYSPSMRATYLSMTDAQIRHFGTDFQV